MSNRFSWVLVGSRQYGNVENTSQREQISFHSQTSFHKCSCRTVRRNYLLHPYLIQIKNMSSNVLKTLLHMTLHWKVRQFCNRYTSGFLLQ